MANLSRRAKFLSIVAALGGMGGVANAGRKSEIAGTKLEFYKSMLKKKSVQGILLGATGLAGGLLLYNKFFGNKNSKNPKLKSGNEVKPKDQNGDQEEEERKNKVFEETVLRRNPIFYIYNTQSESKLKFNTYVYSDLDKNPEEYKKILDGSSTIKDVKKNPIHLTDDCTLNEKSSQNPDGKWSLSLSVVNNENKILWSVGNVFPYLENFNLLVNRVEDILNKRNLFDKFLTDALNNELPYDLVMDKETGNISLEYNKKDNKKPDYDGIVGNISSTVFKLDDSSKESLKNKILEAANEEKNIYVKLTKNSVTFLVDGKELSKSVGKYKFEKLNDRELEFELAVK